MTLSGVATGVTTCVFAVAASVAAQPVEPVYARDQSGHVTIRATRISTPLRIDGKLDEEVYARIPPITDFVQAEPSEAAAVTERTEAWVLFDDENLYVVCRCWDTHADRIVANDMRRDSPNLRNNDNFAVIVDTFHDRRNGFLFYVTPIGAFLDGLTTDERQNNSDWNTVWDAKASRFEEGWIAEMAIPFKSLRYPASRDQVCGINLRRHIGAKNEYAYVSPLKAEWGSIGLFRVSAAATLAGLETPPAGKNLEIKPYGITRLVTDFVGKPRLHNNVQKDGGFDAKYGVTKSLTADITYRTDFAQVEEDEAQVNLTRFNLVFPEKRDFFLEGAGIFNFGGAAGASTGGSAPSPPGSVQPPVAGDAPALFYSRRIGIAGGRTVPIIGGARLTGKAGSWNIGALNITSDRDETVSVPQTTFSVLRLRRDIFRRSTVGGMFTSRSRAVSGVGSNEVWGLDTNMAFYSNVYVSGYVAQSKTERRGGDDMSYRGQFNYTSDRYGLMFDRIEVQKNFNPEVGFIRRDDPFRKNIIAGRFSPRTMDNPLVRKFYYEGNFEHLSDDHNVLQNRTASATARVEFQNSDLLSIAYTRNYEFFRGPFLLSQRHNVLIPIGGYEYGGVSATYNPGQEHHISGSGTIEVGSLYGGNKTTAAFRGRASITPRLAIEPNISINRIDVAQRTFTKNVIGERTLYSMTPRMFVTALVQYASDTTSLSANIRFRWEYQPGSELFVVYTEGRNTALSALMPLENRGFVAKINKLMRF